MRISDWSSDVCSSDLNNPFAICSRDLAVLLDSFGFQPALAHAGRCGADLVLRFERNTLCFETAMIDADIDVEFGKTGVDMIRPALAPLLDKMGSVPFADLRAKTVFAHLSHGAIDILVTVPTPIGHHIDREPRRK